MIKFSCMIFVTNANASNLNVLREKMKKKVLVYGTIVVLLTACSVAKVNKQNKTKHNLTETWVSPSSESCLKHGGKINTKGICEASLAHAKRICKAEGNTLPSIEQLVNLSTECGAKAIPYKGKKSKFSSYIQSIRKDNKKNKQYRQCIKDLDINLLHDYISSTTESLGMTSAVGYTIKNFNFQSGIVRDNSVSFLLQDIDGKPAYIKCVKGK